VRGGRFAPGAKFLTEREIAQRFSTSRPTANKALSSLVSAGMLEVRRGSGTFVREGVLDYDLERLVSFTDKALAAGRKPSTQLIDYRSLSVAEAPAEIVSRLQIGPAEKLIFMERIRLANDTPVIYERRHVVARHCPSMGKRQAKGSLYTCWTEKCGLTITGADEVIHAVNATKAEAAHLHISPGTACFRIVATGLIEGDQPLWHEVTLYRADLYEFRNRISGLAANRAAVGQMIG
jgi:GntR family transcriptional regulator